MSEILKSGKETLQLEADSILHQIELLGDDFEKAVKLIADSKGKLVVTGMGKSGIIGKKIAATLASTGTPSFFMHPGEAYHGDLGMVTPDDLVLALSNSGETDEILKIIPFFLDNGNKIISITSKQYSTLANNSDIHLFIKIEKEACPLELAPTSSTTVTLAMGDALAVALMKLKNFKSENFARFHPGGALGKRLLTKVEHVMQKENLPIITELDNFQKIIHSINKGKLGLALVNEGNKTIGVITDGDLRRLMDTKGKDCFDMMANEMMNNNPKTISVKASLNEADSLFNQYKIASIIVVDDNMNTKGVLQVYNL